MSIVGIAILGLLIGSFLGAYTYRLPRGIQITKGRSICVKCGETVKWFDNIPILSYLLLAGKCRKCNQRISVRYPIIEFVTAATIVLVTIFYNEIIENIEWLRILGLIAIPYLLFISTLLIAIFVIDLERQIIPDNLVFLGLIGVTTTLILTDNKEFYIYLFLGFSVALFLLLLNLITRGRGMGLGDVKLALFLGILLGPTMTILWTFTSFLLGAIVGIILILIGRAKARHPIPFGPFLVVSFFIVLFWGQNLIDSLLRR